MILASALIFVTVALLIVASAAVGSVAVYPYSQSSPSSGAGAGASITVTSSRPGSEGYVAPAPTPVGGGGEGSGEVVSSSAAAGSESACIAKGEGNVSPCYGVTPAPTPGPAPRPPGAARPPVNPAVLAASVATRMSLSAGSISASPPAQTAGLTGLASWFWLEPSPTTQAVSASLRGEHVTVSATAASVQWNFGDGTQLTAGPGVPYRRGAPAAGSVRHTYRTRCLPGDRGHDPYVLSSCGANGYHTEAVVQWSITYQASGPVTTSGVLPGRSASTSLTYPVSEARAFLTAGGKR